MKKAFTLCLASVMLFSASIFGQITFTANDLPSIGTTLIYTNDTSAAGATAGSAGANQTWDLTGYNQITTTNQDSINIISKILPHFWCSMKTLHYTCHFF